MDNRFQFVLLTTRIATLTASLFCAPVLWADESTSQTDISDINNEVFAFGLFTGVINVEDFGSDYIVPGVSFTFRATEDFFIQYNYLEADIPLSAYEKNEILNGDDLLGGDRTFRHYDLLIGYNLFQGEFFKGPGKAGLSTLYTVAGVGDTELGGESSFTYTFGLGYEVALTRHIGINIDFRNYMYESSFVSAKKRTVSATQVSAGASWLF